MVLAACETGVRFIWFDQRRRSPTKLETAFIFLRQWDSWEEELSDPSVQCLKVGRGDRTREVLSIDQARRRAARRFRDSQRGRARVQEHKNLSQQGRLRFNDDE